MLSGERLVGSLGALALVTLLGTAVTAAVVGVRAAEEGAYDGWVTVTGATGSSYRVPADDDWEVHPASYRVSYDDVNGRAVAGGHAPAYYFGNHCSDSRERWPAGWALLEEPREGTENPSARAVASVRRWAAAYGGHDGLAAPMTEPVTEAVELGGGSGVKATVTLDLSGLGGACTPARAEVSAVTRAGSTLVAARYLEVPGAISGRRFARILASLEAD